MTGSKRYFWFVISILVGIGLGIFYGWVINPVQYVDTPTSNLREDYKADYALMVAEIYASDGDLTLASYRLTRLGEETSLKAIQNALETGKTLGYDERDLSLLEDLQQKLQDYEATPEAAQ